MSQKQKLDVPALGLAFGVICGLATLLLGLTASWFGYGTKFVDLIGSVYIGYDATLLGSVIGGAWALLDGLIAGVVIAWLYNRFQRQQG